MRKKIMAGAAILALLMNTPQVSADDDIVIFGGEFEDEATPSTQKKVEKPEPKKPVEKPAPKPKVEEPKEKLPTQPPERAKEPAPPESNVEETLPKPERIEPQDKPPTQPLERVEESSPPESNVEETLPKPERIEPQDKPPTQPLERAEESSPPESNVEETLPKPERIEPQDKPPTQPLERAEEPEPFERPNVEPLELDRPFEQPTVILPSTDAEPSERRYIPSGNNEQKTSLKTLKPRFLKLAVDETYTYYLDKSSVQWKRMPYMANEYMADVWIRMVERNPSRMSDDMESYGADNFRAEVALAREQGYQYSPDDLKVLRSQAYVLEHYYLRPKTKQIQFLCELEVFGRPQNAINERAYEYKNWENLVPGSIESAIYDATIKIIGKSKASDRGHMTFIDMLDEYARIALN